MAKSRGILVCALSQIRFLAMSISIALVLILLYQVYVLTWLGSGEQQSSSYRTGNLRRLQYMDLLGSVQFNSSQSKLTDVAFDGLPARNHQSSPKAIPLEIHATQEPYNLSMRLMDFTRSKGARLELKVPNHVSSEFTQGQRHEQDTQELASTKESVIHLVTSDSLAPETTMEVVHDSSVSTPEHFHEAALHRPASVIVRPKTSGPTISTSQPNPPSISTLTRARRTRFEQKAKQLLIAHEDVGHTQHEVYNGMSHSLSAASRQSRNLDDKKVSALEGQQRQQTEVGQKRLPPFLGHSQPANISRPPSPRTNFSIPFMGNYRCRNPLCLDLLSPIDMEYYERCSAKLRLRQGTDSDPTPTCHFMDGTNRAAVALVSFPGSGNTWVRGLLEQATGICTGAIYCDKSLRTSGLAGEGLRSGAVIAVKTHKGSGRWTDINTPQIDEWGPLYGSAILVIRNPLDAMIAEWNREQAPRAPGNGSTHVQSVGKEHFGEFRGWNIFVKTKIRKWQGYVSNWLLNNDGNPVLPVRFEDLKVNATKEVIRLLEFLKVPYSEEEVSKRMATDVGKFRRKQHQTFQHFTVEQRNIVLSAIQQVVEMLSQWNNGNTLQIEEYLKSSTT